MYSTMVSCRQRFECISEAIAFLHWGSCTTSSKLITGISWIGVIGTSWSVNCVGEAVGVVVEDTPGVVSLPVFLNGKTSSLKTTFLSIVTFCLLVACSTIRLKWTNA
ncbi:hypothetical protein R1flu_007999 [Riccia fluitans]|uniref:Uncharacterized protein n=1 Tax=Riccia fluitans TaxID=41844 RepID=A0ABD1YBG6_9MARC